MPKITKFESVSRGCRINDEIFSKIISNAKNGKFSTERDISRFIKSELKKANAQPAFPPIVAIGKNATNWHHKPTNQKLSSTGFCVIDFGARLNRYCSDMTRTIYFGKASSKERRIYTKVLMANESCIRKVKGEKNGNEIYKTAKKILGRYAKYFGHGLGHGLGKKIHAKPKLGKKIDRNLREGDIVTIEPGVYIPKKLGIRIEDDVLVTKTGYKVLSKSTKKLIEIPIKKIEYGLLQFKLQ